jgi:hypothetical protein
MDERKRNYTRQIGPISVCLAWPLIFSFVTGNGIQNYLYLKGRNVIGNL